MHRDDLARGEFRKRRQVYFKRRRLLQLTFGIRQDLTGPIAASPDPGSAGREKRDRRCARRIASIPVLSFAAAVCGLVGLSRASVERPLDDVGLLDAL